MFFNRFIINTYLSVLSCIYPSISNNQQVQGLGSKESNITNNLNKVDDYTQKYIKMLEDKIQQLESK